MHKLGWGNGDGADSALKKIKTWTNPGVIWQTDMEKKKILIGAYNQYTHYPHELVWLTPTGIEFARSVVLWVKG